MVFLHLFQPLGIDFPQYYEAARMALLGLNPYIHLLTSPGPFNYPPPSLLFLILFGLLPFSFSGPIWNILSVLSLIASIWLILKLSQSFNTKLPSYNLITIFAICLSLFTLPFFPVKHNLASGQINLFLLFFVVTSLFLYLRRHKSLSAAFLALAIAIKLIPVLFLLYFAVVGDWKQLVRIILCTVAFFLLSLAILPWNFQQVYYTSIIFQTLPIAGKAIYYNQSLQGFLVRSFQGGAVAQGLNYGLSLFILLLTFFVGRRLNAKKVFAAVSCLPLILSPLAWQHHFVFAIIPLVLLWQKNDWLIFVISYLLLALDIKNFNQLPREFNFLLSHDFFGIVLLWIYALWREKFWKIVSIIWVWSVISAYTLMLLCRAKFCL